jgi:hypothetical protein
MPLSRGDRQDVLDLTGYYRQVFDAVQGGGHDRRRGSEIVFGALRHAQGEDPAVDAEQLFRWR